MAKKKARKQKTMVAQHNTRHGAALGVPQATADVFMVLYNAKKLEQAREAAQDMVALYPNSAFAWKALGTTYIEDNQVAEALPALEQSLSLNPNDALTLTSLASACFRLGDFKNAVKYQQKAVTIKPEYAIGQYNLAEMLQSAGQLLEALDHAKKAKQLGFNEFRCLVLIGALQYQTKYFSDAFSVYKKLERDFPPHYAVYNNLGNLYKDIGDYQQAEAYYQKSLTVNPNHVTAYSNIFYAKHYNPAVKQDEIFEFAKQWDKNFSLESLSLTDCLKNSTRSLRIGLVSSGFRLHPVGQMIATALEESRSDILFYGYTTNDQADSITEKIRSVCQDWRTIRHLSQRDIAHQIRNDQIDILIDLSGHGDGSCLQAISMRPAPLCIKWVGGLVNTMGLESIDYLLSDSIETPVGVDSQYTEKLIRLPDDYICYMPCSYAPSTTSLPALKNRYITLGCLNNPAKISSELLNEWAVLMNQLADSRLLLRGPQYESHDFCRRIWDVMAEHGISQERVLLEGPARHKEFLETYQRIDIALDTWPYSGGLTTCEAMLMGVPVVTLPGPTFAGRHSATHLINAGLPELVTNSWDEYRHRVMELASDLPNLAVIRAGLRTILHYSPVCDAPRFANHFNNALRAIWVRYCEDKAPEALTFNKEGEMWFADEGQLVELPDVSIGEVGEAQAFEWKFDEPIIIVDNAAVLPRHPDYPKWMASGHLAVIGFDPASLLSKKVEELKEFGELHHYPHALLGDGQPATLYATMDAEKGSTLKPLPEDQLQECQREKLKVLAELAINSVALDSIEGLASVDMLVLDNLHDAMKVLEGGVDALKDTLLIQARVAFQFTHEHQPSLVELQHWASRNGFHFYCLNASRYISHLPESISARQRQATELESADAIFLPSHERMATLTGNQRNKLAFLLHTIYCVKDMTYKLLAEVGEEKAEEYLIAECLANKKLEPTIKREVIYDPSLLECNQREFTLCVGVPVYNEEKYIRETIKSLKKQDFGNVKFLISDNCSTDNTLNTICEETAGDDRFEVFQQRENVGAGRNFEFIFEVSKSKYFMWLGAHDSISENYLSNLIAMIEGDSDVSMVMGKPVCVDEESKIKGIMRDAVYKLDDSDRVERYITSVKCLSNCTVFHSIFRRSSLADFKFEITVSADHVLISHLLWKGKLKNSTDCSYFRRFIKSAPQSRAERITGKNVVLERKDFFKYYLDDFNCLAKGIPDNVVEDLSNLIFSILETRFC
jgi:predicted O-linked N-acetylglucosamine transferase (SPINDLY family)/glycosyltransferase involved in cell wall biosynthesis